MSPRRHSWYCCLPVAGSITGWPVLPSNTGSPSLMASSMRDHSASEGSSTHKPPEGLQEKGNYRCREILQVRKGNGHQYLPVHTGHILCCLTHIAGALLLQHE